MPYFSTPTITDKSVNRRVHNLFKTLKARQPSVLEQQSFVLDMLVQLILQFAENRPTLKPVGDEHQPIQRVRDYLEDNYVENVSLEQLAQIANLSPFYLNRAFCKIFGLPPHAYQTQVRIARAKNLLAKGEPIGQVALKTGFAHQSHFGWHFRRLVTVTPRQYAKDSKNSIDNDS